MATFLPYDRDQAFLLSRDLKAWLGLAAIDGTKIDANASKIRSVRYDRAQALRQNLAEDIAALTAQAEAADAGDTPHPQALSKRIARRERLRAQLDAACARLEAAAQREGEAACAEVVAKQAELDAKTGRRGCRPKSPPDDAIPKPQALANAEFTTLRMRLLKITARITETATPKPQLGFASPLPPPAPKQPCCVASRSAFNPPTRDARGGCPECTRSRNPNAHHVQTKTAMQQAPSRRTSATGPAGKASAR